MKSFSKILMTISFVCCLEDALRFKNRLYVFQEIFFMESGWKHERHYSGKTIQLMCSHGKMAHNEQSLEFTGLILTKRPSTYWSEK